MDMGLDAPASVVCQELGHLWSLLLVWALPYHLNLHPLVLPMFPQLERTSHKFLPGARWLRSATTEHPGFCPMAPCCGRKGSFPERRSHLLLHVLGLRRASKVPKENNQVTRCLRGSPLTGFTLFQHRTKLHMEQSQSSERNSSCNWNVYHI